MDDNKMRRGAGGTPGGLGEFVIGALMILIGGYLFFNNLVVRTTYISAWYGNSSGIALLVLLIGIGFLFFSRRAWVGWILVAAGVILIMVQVISNLTILFKPTSFFSTVLMLGLIFGGLGLVFRALRPH